jgi:hypothetical protein
MIVVVEWEILLWNGYLVEWASLPVPYTDPHRGGQGCPLHKKKNFVISQDKLCNIFEFIN